MEITRINKYLGIRRGLFPASYTSIRGMWSFLFLLFSFTVWVRFFLWLSVNCVFFFLLNMHAFGSVFVLCFRVFKFRLSVNLCFRILLWLSVNLCFCHLWSISGIKQHGKKYMMNKPQARGLVCGQFVVRERDTYLNPCMLKLLVFAA